jgi:putative ABC transport system substrate-binding protein
MNVNVIVTHNVPGTQAAQRATSRIPIVFTSIVDPIGSGVSKTLTRPDSNATGLALMSIDIVPKQVELLAAIIPKLSRIALLVNPHVTIHSEFLRATQAAAQKIGAKILPVEAKSPKEIERGFATIMASGAQALMIPPDAFFGGQKKQIAQLALKNRVPTIFPYGSDADEGGLLSYGPYLLDFYRRAAVYVDKILKGAKPSDLPIEQPTIFQFSVNLKTAKALGIKFSPEILMRADRVIE